MITIVAKCILKTGKKEVFVSSVQDLIIDSRKEVGNIAYDLYEDLNDDNTVAFIEKWKDQESIDSHNKSQHFLVGLKVLKELSESIEIKCFNQIL